MYGFDSNAQRESMPCEHNRSWSCGILLMSSLWRIGSQQLHARLQLLLSKLSEILCGATCLFCEMSPAQDMYDLRNSRCSLEPLSPEILQ
jgi:hypothetical protein